MKFHLERATDGKHKWVGVFEGEGTHRRVPFGAKGYEDYTQHHNPLRKENYLTRHRAREDWKDPMTAGALSRWILWEYPSLERSVREFKRKFSFE